MIPSRKKITDYNFVCLCNAVTMKTIEKAVLNGADSLDKIFDKTTAGVGGCGGSCRIDLKQILLTFQTSGKFPVENPRKTRLNKRFT